MAPKTRRPLVLTSGDPAGIGPEITLRAWLKLRRDKSVTFAVLAPLSVINTAAASLGAPQAAQITNLSQAGNVFESGLPVIDIDGPSVQPGKPSADAAPAIVGSIRKSVNLALSREADGIITNPIAKHVLYDAGFAHPGHTEYLGKLTQATAMNSPRGPVMMLAGGGLRVALATVHLPLAEAARLLNQADISRNIQVMHHALIQDFGLENPRIALTGLNPHAGENGALGQEEIDIINPAAVKLRAQGFDVTNAQPADTLFHAEARAGYDAVLAMYHDQGLIPVKTLDFHGGVNITLGLPIVRTSPDHGTAFGIAGQNIARPDSLIAAIKTARSIADNRFKYDA